MYQIIAYRNKIWFFQYDNGNIGSWIKRWYFNLYIITLLYLIKEIKNIIYWELRGPIATFFLMHAKVSSRLYEAYLL